MIAIVAAFSLNRVLGYEGRIPWSIPGEQKRFRSLTVGHTVIMGRRTYSEIARPLPKRRNIVITSTKRFAGVECVPTLEVALRLAGNDDVFLSGGERVYREGLRYADILYLTRVHMTTPGDTFFPEFDISDYTLTEITHFPGAIPYTYLTYIRK